MRRIVWLTAVLLAAATSAWAADPPTPMGEYVMGFLYRGPKWSPEPDAAAKKLLEGHMANIQRMVDSGELAVAGPFEDAGDLAGVFIFNVKTVAAARALADSDPAVRGGRFTVKLYKWWGPAALATVAKKK